MKAIKVILVMAMTMLLIGTVRASNISAKVWYAEATDIEDPALLYGATGYLDLGANIWISAMFLTGTYDGNDTDGNRIRDVDTTDAEALIGCSLLNGILDIGVGGRFSVWEWQGIQDDFQMFGPTAYIGLGDNFGDLPLGWYVGGSYMFKDFGDADDKNWAATYEHYNVEGGIYGTVGALVATVGYRYKDYTDSKVDLDFRGVTASIGLGF
jgi:hypothetical protein